MRAWRDTLGRTWLGEPDTVRRADDFARACLVQHRGGALLDRQRVAPWSVERLVADIRTFGDRGEWIWATSATCLLAELLFAATSGTTFRVERSRTGREADAATRALYILRNAAFHPAHAASSGAGEPHVARLVEHLRGNGDDFLAARLERSWAFLAERPIAEFAIGKLDGAVRVHPETRGVGW